MAAPKLTDIQRLQVLEWLTADYDSTLILHWIKERRTREKDPEPWPEDLDPSAIRYYRSKWKVQIEEARAARHSAALNAGLALKEERVARLKEHADKLEAIKWVADPKTGRLWNEKAWREVLDDIAKEMGHRRQGIDLDVVEAELDAALDKLKAGLSPELYAQVLAALARG